MLADADAECFQTQAPAVAAAAGSEEHRIEHTVHRAVMAERTHALAIALQFAQAIAEVDPHALLFQVLGQLIGQLVIEALQQALPRTSRLTRLPSACSSPASSTAM